MIGVREHFRRQACGEVRKEAAIGDCHFVPWIELPVGPVEAQEVVLWPLIKPRERLKAAIVGRP